MPELIDRPETVEAAGNLPKVIEEFVGRVKGGTTAVSIARRQSPSGWEELGQRPELDEFTVVLCGLLVVEHDDDRFEVRAGQAVHTGPGEWVPYSSPSPEGAE